VTLEIEDAVVVLRLVPRFLRLDLCELGRERTRIDLGEEIAGFHTLALDEGDFLELSIHPRFDDHRVDRRDVADARRNERHGLPRHDGGGYRHRGRRAWRGTFLLLRLLYCSC